MTTGNAATAQPSAAEAAYASIKARILRGELEGGTLVSEGELATALGVSRTPVREAFLRLQAEGWMRLFPKRGALVVPVRPGEHEEVLEARALVEGHAVERVRRDEAATRRLCERLRGIIEVQRAHLLAGAVEEFSAADVDFHLAIVEAGGNRLLSDFYAGLRERQERMSARSVSGRADRAERIIADHAALVEAIAAGDAPGFSTALTAHMHGVHRDLLP